MTRPLASLAWCVVIGIHATACTASGEDRDRDEAALNDGRAIPCAPLNVLVRVCQNCHAEEPSRGASFSLVTYADTQVAVGNEPLSAHMLRAVERGIMPAPPYSLTEDDRASLVSWLSSGAPPRKDGETCP